MKPSSRHAHLVAGVACACAALLGAAPALAQYKVVSPEGRITYTDRAPGPSDGRVAAINGRNAPAAAENEALPFELRQAASKYPVTLYVATSACDPCESARTLLRQRGVPYVERTITTVEDGEALMRLTGSREAPTLAIGSQVVRGLSSDLWNSYLDAAGYPRESKLPSNYAFRPATPLVERQQQASARPADAASRTPDATSLPPPAPAGAIRF
jgi:glutaredoxin